MEKFWLSDRGTAPCSEKSNNRPSAAGWRAFPPPSNFHPTLGYAPPQPHLGILLGGLRASAAALLQVGAWIRMRSQFATSAVQGSRARSEEPHL